ncbi:hypothetical protein [Streptomyces colonosanans]|nr:hypothetical protein [Streptomyces colonosanans]
MTDRIPLHHLTDYSHHRALAPAARQGPPGCVRELVTLRPGY